MKPVNVLLLAFAVVACSRPAPEASPAAPARDLGAQVGDTASDTAAMREANDAANTVIRAAGDCDAVKAALPDTNARLDAVSARLVTATGKTSLDSLRKQVATIASACPQ